MSESLNWLITSLAASSRMFSAVQYRICGAVRTLPLPTGGVSSVGRDGTGAGAAGCCHTGGLVAIGLLVVADGYEGVVPDDFLSDSETSHINPKTTAIPISHLPPEPIPAGCTGAW
jgi:hypothetical protein